jgi:hypothetical protein
MKKLHYILIGVTALIGISSCGSDQTTTSEAGKETSENKQSISYVYSVLPETAELNWTGFKLAEKVGVNGSFKNFSLSGFNQEANSVVELMTGTEIQIEVGSTKTGDEARDGKIINSFFGSMNTPETISAKIIKLNGEESGKATVSITMNGETLEKQLDWSYTKNNFTFMIKGNLNVPDWKAQNALDELNKVCEEKHRGDGDVSVTWPDADVSAFVLIEETPKKEL